jgi:hypothetical protein
MLYGKRSTRNVRSYFRPRLNRRMKSQYRNYPVTFFRAIPMLVSQSRN